MKHSATETVDDWRNGGFGLYIHWPFCASKCPYCDFNSHVSNAIDHAAWRAAYVSEIERLAKLTQGRTLDSIFLGGGTPSTMSPETVAAIIDAARKAWPTRNSLEITLEANPASVDIVKFRDFSSAGVNRVSLGIQSFDDDALRLLGRLHSASDAKRALGVAQSVFERVSFDLIYARQYQNLADWEVELTAALAHSPTHLSLYQLTIEDGTAFGDRYKLGRLPGLPSSDAGADLYELTQTLCETAGLAAYEVSNHSRASEESRHNLIYWRYGDYIGIGPGAHGRLSLGDKKYAYESIKAPGSWLKSVSSGSTAHESRDELARQDQATEYMMMSLRLAEGTDIRRWIKLGGYEAEPPAIEGLVEQGFLWRENGRIGATKIGRPVLNSILAEIL